MTRYWEGPVFFAVALAIHVAFWIQLPARSIESAGDQGEAFVSVAAADGALEALIAEWEEPSETTPETEKAAHSQPDLEPISEPQPVELEPLTDVTDAPVPEVPDAPEPTDIVTQAIPLPTRAPTRPVRQRQPERTEAAPVRTRERQTEQARSSSAPAVRQQRAAGTGGGETVGRQAPTQVASIDPSRKRSLMAEWGGKIQSRIARRARSGAQASGRVVLQLLVQRNGIIQDVRVLRTSGNPTVDQAAIAAVGRTGRVPSAPRALPGDVHKFQIPITIGG